MKPRPTTVSILLAACLCANVATSYAQATDPPYLNQFPAASRIRNEIKGTDAVDTSARIMAAFDVLIETVRKMSGERYRRNYTTPDEQKFDGRYNDALEPYTYRTNAPPQAEQARWNGLRLQYRTDPAFRDELFRQFFPPGFKELYEKTVGQSGAPTATSQAVGTSTLNVVSGIPATPGKSNPLAGGGVALLKGKDRPDPMRPDYKVQLRNRAAAEGRLDLQGRSTIGGLVPGEYYALVIGVQPGATRVFETPVVIGPGVNTVTITDNNTAVASGSSPRASAPAASLNGASPPAAQDPDLVKAATAKVDTRVAGIQLGEPFRFPECNLFEVRPARSPCIPIEAGGLAGELLQMGGAEVDPNIKTVALPSDNCPTWTPVNCRAYITLYEGRMVGVALLTKGRGVVSAAKAELQEKYGRPTGFINATITPDEGNPFKVTDPEWILPGIHVEFETVLKEGDRVNLSNGVVRIETTNAYARRLAKSKTVKRKL